MAAQYPPEFKTRLALAVLRGESSARLALQHDVPEQLLIDWALALAQKSRRLVEDPAAAEAAPQPSQLCFIRNEKTAGTALASHLEDLYDASAVCPVIHHDELVDQGLRRNLREFGLLHGHFYVGWFLSHSTLDLRNTRFITFLRHPLERQISLYKHWMREPTRLTNTYVNRLLDLYNIQCLKLSPLPMRGNYATTREHLEAAKGALEDFFFVGVQDHFRDSVDALYRLLGYPAPAQIRDLNTDPYRYPDLPQALKDEIVATNWADMELHAHALALYQRKFAAKDAPSGSPPAMPPAERVAHRMNHPLYGDGWYFREGQGSELPQVWRWSGPGRESWMAFHVYPQRDYRLSVRVVNSLAADVLASLRIFVNDTPVALTESRDALWGLMLHGSVPKAAFAFAAPNARIRFSVGRTVRFCDADPKSPDRRHCGIAISEVNLEPQAA